MPRAHGFTLYEMLIAVTLVALLSLFAYQGFDQVARASAQQELSNARLAAVQRSLSVLANDLEQAQPRPVREAYHGSLEPALRGGAGAALPLELTRAGWRNPTGANHGPLQRVSYAVIDGDLVRSVWRVLDRAPDSEPAQRVLLEGVSSLEVAFLVGDGWAQDWPPADVDVATGALPRAVRVAFSVEGEGRIERVVELLGTDP
jgi:general secretion pathway protein J